MTRKRLITALVAALGLAIAVFLFPRFLTRNHDLRGALAAALQVSADRQQDFFTNLPPASSRLPGSILATRKLLVLDATDANNQDIHAGARFQLSTDDAIAASALGSLSVPVFREAAENKQAISLELRVENGKVLEMDGPQLKRRVLESQAARDAANKGTDPLIITRAYSGQLTFVLRQRSKESGELWSRLERSGASSKDDRLHISADRATAGELTVEVRDPVVFAFEASAASFITSHLGVEPTDVQLRPVRPADLGGQAMKITAPSKSWLLATISSGHYPSLQTLRQDWNASSASLVGETLAEYAPARASSLTATEERPLSESEITGFVADVGKSARENHLQFVLVYYVGHMLTWPSGDIALILGDARDVPHFAPIARKEVIDDAFGKKIGDLSRLADAISANVELLPEGFLPLRALYSDLEKMGVPFALVVDGCLRMDEFERSREALGIVSDRSGNSFFYVGTDSGATHALSQLGVLIRHAADAQPFLHSTNPVILAAKPGTYAFAIPNPDLSWGTVGPMAARLANLFRASRFDADRPTLAGLIERVVDFRGTGEIAPKGSISWSDFSQFHTAAESIPYPSQGQ